LTFYIVIAWFVQSVKETKSLLFFLKKPYWRDSFSEVKLSSENLNVEIKNLTKTFGNLRAVDSLNLSIQSNEIFALLGHNGAGKSTAINMLAGYHKPTSGDAFVFGNSIRSNMSQIQQILGVCSQEDVLYEQLTVEDHLHLVASIKNVDANIDIFDYLSKLEMTDKRQERTKVLSGGMKRKLCVILAFLGNPKFIILDEPTAGMDAYARRKVWSMLQEAKVGKIILLTTHSMEEADLLGDRIAVMSKGKEKCVGTSLELKKSVWHWIPDPYRVEFGSKIGL